MAVTQDLNTRGPKVYTLVKVSSAHTGLIFLKVKYQLELYQYGLVDTHTPMPGAPPPIAVDRSTCPVCGTVQKTGIHSCCAAGGSWFRNCGDGKDARFDYTWTEGVQACRAFASQALVLPDEKTESQLSKTRERDDSQHNIPDSMSGDVSDGDTVNCKGCGKMTTIAGVIGLLLISLQM